MNIRIVDFREPQHRETVIEYHCRTNDASITFEPGQKPMYDVYRNKWWELEANSFFAHIQSGLKENQIIIKMIYDGTDAVIGYFYADLMSYPEWNVRVADIADVYVEEAFQRKGIGTMVLAYIEQYCRDNGLNLIRSGSGAHNLASIGLHQKMGFVVSRHEFEKWI